MNICFIIGKIIDVPKFDFIFNQKSHISIIRFKLKILSNSSIININAYDNEADYIYRFFSKNDVIILKGFLNNNIINVEDVKKL